MSAPTSTLESPAPPPTSWAEQARQERTLEETARRRARSRARRSARVPRHLDLGAIIALLTVAALTHGGVFGGLSGYVAALGGVAVGAGTALLAARMRMHAPMTVVAVLIGYLALGGALALPRTTIAHVVPTLRTLQLLVVGIVTSWKDLLTVQPPAGAFIGPAVMPYLAGVLCSSIAVSVVVRTRRPLWALAPAAVLLLLGILWGSQSAPLALPVGVAWGALALVWAGACAARQRREGGRGTVEFEGAGRRPRTRRLVGATVLVLLGALCAATLSPVLVDGGHRSVLRDLVEPPLDLREYHSPISLFRTLNTDQADAEQFTVSGLPEGGRIRLATLDTYDGTVFKIAGDAAEAGFRHVGTEFTDTPLAAGASTAHVAVTISGYTGNWVPGGGATRSLDYTSSRQDELAEALFYSDSLVTGLSTVSLQEGDSYTAEVVTGREWSDQELEGKAFMQVPIPEDTNVPASVAEVASTMVADATAGIGQVRAIQQKLHDGGFYSDGTDGLSLPGHRADRLEKFLTDEQMIGDDDQYAPAMALMLRSLGIPSRVVMGFHPDEGVQGDVTITGKETHAWVEVPFDGAGWVAFDPTPPRDQVPQTQVPKPKPNPRPQVLQPPDPPEEPAEVPPDVVEQPDDDREPEGSWWDTVLVALEIAGVGMLLVSPFVAIVSAKARRARRRRRRGPQDVRTAAAWDEVVDRATDLGVLVPATDTRSDQARSIDTQLGVVDPAAGDTGFHRWDEPRTRTLELATQLDGIVFGAGTLDEGTGERAWVGGGEVIAAMRRQVPRLRRLRGTFSTRSLRVRRRRWRDRWRDWRATGTGTAADGNGDQDMGTGSPVREPVRSGNG